MIAAADVYPVLVFVGGMVWMKIIDLGQGYYRQRMGVQK